jgi:3-oxoacyl-[acyl-carrier protein] reductase
MKVLLIGGSRGLGLEMYSRLVNDGHDVLTLSRTSTWKLDLKKMSEGLIYNTVRYAGKRLGGVDALIVSSGLSYETGALTRMSDTADLMRVNYESVVTCYRAALRPLLRSKGKVILVSSTVARPPSAVWLTHYAASKAALEGWFIGESRRLARKGLGMCIVRPGWFTDGMADNLEPATKARSERAIPMGRFGTAAEVADFTLSFLDRSNWCIAGRTFEATGGA